MAIIYHISDLHVKDSIFAWLHNRRVDSLISKVIHDYDVSHAGEDAVVLLTGDLVDSGGKREYRKLEKYLDRLDAKMKVRFVPGNHDIGGGGGTLFSRESVEEFEKLAARYGFNAGYISKYNSEYPGYTPFHEIFAGKNGDDPVRVLYLNSCCEDQMGDFARGNLGMYQLNALEKALINQAGIQTVICIHHKPLEQATPRFIMDLEREDRKALRYFIKKYGVAAMLYGHKDPRKEDPASFPPFEDNCAVLNANRSVKDCFFHKLLCTAEGITVKKI